MGKKNDETEMAEKPIHIVSYQFAGADLYLEFEQESEAQAVFNQLVEFSITKRHYLISNKSKGYKLLFVPGGSPMMEKDTAVLPEYDKPADLILRLVNPIEFKKF